MSSKRVLPVVGVALALCVAAWWFQTPVAAQKVTNAGKWEYKVLTVKRDKQGVFPIDEKSLNDLGNDRWEVAGTTEFILGRDFDTAPTIILKRPKK